MTSGLERSIAVALQLFDLGRRADAEALCQNILKLAPHDPTALHLQGALAFVSGAMQQAVASILRAIALAPAQAGFHNTLGCAQLALGRLRPGHFE